MQKTDKAGLVSIIIPVYNRQEFIKDCIDSVTAQSYQNYEIIMVDDGSTDNSYDLCLALAAQDDRIKVFSADHGGVSNARNIALDKASGEYVFFLDSDDAIYPLLLETLVTAMQGSNAAIGGSEVAAVTNAHWDLVRQKCCESPTPGETQFLTFEESLDAMFCHSSPLGCIGGVMIRRDLIKDTRFRTDLHIGEDFYFIYKNLIKGASCIFLRPKWYFSRIHDSNLSLDYSYSGFWSRFYRRKLVWESEESFNRKKYADIQKIDAFGCFMRCFNRNRPYSPDGKKMRKTLKQHKKAMLPAFTPKQRLVFNCFLYFPWSTAHIVKLKRNKQR